MKDDEETARKPQFNAFHLPPVARQGDEGCTTVRKEPDIQVKLAVGGIEYKFAVQRYTVQPGDPLQKDAAFTQLYFTVPDKVNESQREQRFWERVIYLFWAEAGQWLNDDEREFSDEEKSHFDAMRQRGIIALALNKRNSALTWDRFGIKDEARVILDHYSKSNPTNLADIPIGRIVTELESQKGSDRIPVRDFMFSARGFLTSSTCIASESADRHEYKTVFLPQFLDKCWAMQVAAMVPKEQSPNGLLSYHELAKPFGQPFAKRCRDIAGQSSGDDIHDRSLFLSAISELADSIRKNADSKQRQYLEFLQSDMDYALLYAYSHIAKWLIELPEVKSQLNNASLSCNYFAHTFQRPLLRHVPSLHPFWNLCLMSWPCIKRLIDLTPDIISPNGETLNSQRSQTAGEEINNCLILPLYIYDKLVTDRPMYKGKNPNRVTLYSDSNARGVDPTETEEDEIDEDDGQTDPEESERAESTISAGGAGVYPESMENIEDRHAGHSPENTELREFFEKQMTSGDRNIQIAIDRVYNGMSGQECALKYNCSVSAISKKEIKGLAALKQTLRAKGLTP